jgi:hypothetical protein
LCHTCGLAVVDTIKTDDGAAEIHAHLPDDAHPIGQGQTGTASILAGSARDTDMTDPPTTGVEGSPQDDPHTTALLALVRAAGVGGASSAELKIGCRMIRDQERLLAGLEAAGLVRSGPELLRYAGRRWFAVEGDAT